MGIGKGSGRGRPKGSKNRPTKPQTVSGGREYGALTAAQRAAERNPGVAPFAPTADARAPRREEEDAEDPVYLSADDEPFDLDHQDPIIVGPLLDAAKEAIKTLPRVEGQTRKKPIDVRIWKDYDVRLPLPTLYSTMRSDPRVYACRVVTILAYHEFHGELAGPIHCPACGSPDKVAVCGWANRLKAFSGLEEQRYVFSRMYRCTRCPQKECVGNTNFAAHHPDVMRRLPDFIKGELGLVPTAKSGVEAIVLRQRLRHVTAGGSETDFANMLLESHFERHDDKQLVYLSHAVQCAESAKRKRETNRLGAFLAEPPDPLNFPTLDQLGVGTRHIPSRPYLDKLADEHWESENLEQYYESLIERVGEEDETIDIQIDHTFTLCKYIADNHQRVANALLKVLHARTGEYIAYHFVASTSHSENDLLAHLKDRFGSRINVVTLDNAAGGQEFARTAIGAKFALRSIIHIMDIIVQSTVHAHPLRTLLYANLSRIFYTLDAGDVQRVKKRLWDVNKKPVLDSQLKEARRRGKIRSYVVGDGLAVKFRETMDWWATHGIQDGVPLFTPATLEVVNRVVGWIECGEVADPPGVTMWANHGTEDAPRWVSLRDTCKLEGSNTRDHAVFRPGHTASRKAHRRMLQSVARRNHSRQIDYRGGPNFKHFNFKLIDALQGHQRQLGILGSDSPVAKWRTPRLVTNSKMGVKALERISLDAEFPEDGRLEEELAEDCLQAEKALLCNERLPIPAGLDADKIDEMETRSAFPAAGKQPTGRDDGNFHGGDGRVGALPPQSPGAASSPESVVPSSPPSPAAAAARARVRNFDSTVAGVRRASTLSQATAFRFDGGEVDADASEASAKRPRHDPPRIGNLMRLPDHKSSRSVELFWELRPRALVGDGREIDYDVMTRIWNATLSARAGQEGVAGIPLTNTTFMKQFEAKIAEQHAAHEAMAEMRLRQPQPHGRRYGTMTVPQWASLPQLNVTGRSAPLAVTPALVGEIPQVPPLGVGIGRGAPGKPRYCGACRRAGVEVRITSKHRKECPNMRKEAQAKEHAVVQAMQSLGDRG